ncbi:MAG: argininosuccinate lyase, partial [Candidatus Omnitrophica bacterium]|nr:argininosuccinate lyase [Candidatus Omnitrophota bacterium]
MKRKLWGGRFAKDTDPLVERFTKSIHYDYKLAKYDVVGSLIHVSILKQAGLLKPAEAKRLQKALKDIYDDIKK